jgi:hypothetical protein
MRALELVIEIKLDVARADRPQQVRHRLQMLLP